MSFYDHRVDPVPRVVNYDPRAHGARCDECPLRGTTPVVPPIGPLDAVVAIVGEGPGLQETKRLEPFVGPSGQFLNEVLKRSGLVRKDIWISNSTLCRQKVPDMDGAKAYELKTYLAWLRRLNGQRKKSKQPLIPSPIDCCRPRLLAELRRVDQVARERGCPNGGVVIALGNFAWQAVSGKQGVMKHLATHLEVDPQ